MSHAVMPNVDVLSHNVQRQLYHQEAQYGICSTPQAPVYENTIIGVPLMGVIDNFNQDMNIGSPSVEPVVPDFQNRMLDSINDFGINSSAIKPELPQPTFSEELFRSIEDNNNRFGVQSTPPTPTLFSTTPIDNIIDMFHSSGINSSPVVPETYYNNPPVLSVIDKFNDDFGVQSTPPAPSFELPINQFEFKPEPLVKRDFEIYKPTPVIDPLPTCEPNSIGMRPSKMISELFTPTFKPEPLEPVFKREPLPDIVPEFTKPVFKSKPITSYVEPKPMQRLDPEMKRFSTFFESVQTQTQTHLKPEPIKEDPICLMRYEKDSDWHGLMQDTIEKSRIPIMARVPISELHGVQENVDPDRVDFLKERIKKDGYNDYFPIIFEEGLHDEKLIYNGHHRKTAVTELIEELPQKESKRLGLFDVPIYKTETHRYGSFYDDDGDKMPRNYLRFVEQSKTFSEPDYPMKVPEKEWLK